MEIRSSKLELWCKSLKQSLLSQLCLSLPPDISWNKCNTLQLWQVSVSVFRNTGSSLYVQQLLKLTRNEASKFRIFGLLWGDTSQWISLKRVSNGGSVSMPWLHDGITRFWTDEHDNEIYFTERLAELALNGQQRWVFTSVYIYIYIYIHNIISHTLASYVMDEWLILKLKKPIWLESLSHVLISVKPC